MIWINFKIVASETCDPELTLAMKWLWEKKIFDILRQIKIFRLFRKRKTFKCWFRHIRENKQIRAR